MAVCVTLKTVHVCISAQLFSHLGE
jgi:hypothetical protein